MLTRQKNPKVDLKRKYKTTFEICLILSLALHLVVFLSWRKMEVKAYETIAPQQIIKVEDIPQTQQIQRPPPPARPTVPIEVDSEELPDDVTIETTELDVHETPPPPPELPPAPEEEIYEFYHVEIKPKLVKAVKPEYPEIARKAGIEGTVFIKMLVGKDGKVERVEVLKGPEIFHESAIKAAMQFEFTPAIQNDRPVRVWVGQAIVFRLKD